MNLLIKSKICLFIKLVERPSKSMIQKTLDIFLLNFSEHFGNIIFSNIGPWNEQKTEGEKRRNKNYLQKIDILKNENKHKKDEDDDLDLDD